MPERNLMMQLRKKFKLPATSTLLVWIRLAGLPILLLGCIASAPTPSPAPSDSRPSAEVADTAQDFLSEQTVADKEIALNYTVNGNGEALLGPLRFEQGVLVMHLSHAGASHFDIGFVSEANGYQSVAFSENGPFEERLTVNTVGPQPEKSPIRRNAVLTPDKSYYIAVSSHSAWSVHLSHSASWKDARPLSELEGQGASAVIPVILNQGLYRYYGDGAGGAFFVKADGSGQYINAGLSGGERQRIVNPGEEGLYGLIIPYLPHIKKWFLGSLTYDPPPCPDLPFYSSC